MCCMILDIGKETRSKPMKYVIKHQPVMVDGRVSGIATVEMEVEYNYDLYDLSYLVTEGELDEAETDLQEQIEASIESAVADAIANELDEMYTSNIDIPTTPHVTGVECDIEDLEIEMDEVEVEVEDEDEMETA